MRIISEYKAIYVHIPKTAGNSISDAIDNLPNCNPLAEYKGWQPKHIRAWELKALTGDEMWNSHFTFAFVRNPLDQMVSCYNWWTQVAPQWPKNDEAVTAIRNAGDFNGFMQLRYGREMINEFDGSTFDWISDKEGNLIVDYIARFENLQDDWREICHRMSAPHKPLPHLNKTDRAHYRDYYTDETRNFIVQRFRKTIEMFGYTY